jgi:hypothetical protein
MRQKRQRQHDRGGAERGAQPEQPAARAPAGGRALVSSLERSATDDIAADPVVPNPRQTCRGETTLPSIRAAGFSLRWLCGRFRPGA